MIVVADTTPLNYLIRLGQVGLLKSLYGEVCIPLEVVSEMKAAGAPIEVRSWAAELPAWVFVSTDTKTDDPELLALDPGECAAITLAIRLRGALLLLDEREGRAVAARKGVALSGTMGVIRDGAKRGLIEFDEAVKTLRHLGFRVSDLVVDQARRGIS